MERNDFDPRFESIGTIQDGQTYEERLFHYSFDPEWKTAHFRIYRGMQRVNLVRLENDIGQMKNKMWGGLTTGTKDEMETLTKLLHDYAEAVRDYEYLNKLEHIQGSREKELRADLTQAFPELAEGAGNPFSTGYRQFTEPTLRSSDPLRNLLKNKLPRSLTYTNEEMYKRTDEYLQGRPPERISPFVDSLARFIVAFAGGFALIVPMLIMRLPTVSLAKSLSTASISVLLFSVILSVGFRASNTESLVATATYTAVMVVFVGTSS